VTRPVLFSFILTKLICIYYLLLVSLWDRRHYHVDKIEQMYYYKFAMSPSPAYKSGLGGFPWQLNKLT